MAYTTPITDRTQSDIAAQNSKAFWNVADWTRVYGNSLETNTALNTALGLAVSFDTITTVTNTDIPTVTEINEFLANIERMRSLLSANITNVDFVEIKDDWLAGQLEDAPNFSHVNSWEKVTDIIYQIYKATYTAEGTPICGAAICGASDLGV